MAKRFATETATKVGFSRVDTHQRCGRSILLAFRMISILAPHTSHFTIQAVHECARLLGSTALLASSPVDRVIRDLRACGAVGGTSEVMAVAVFSGIRGSIAEQ